MLEMILLLLAAAWLGAGWIISLCRIRRPSERLRIAAKACSWTGVSAGVIELICHGFGREGWLPLDDNVDALVWLALLLAVFVLYVQRTRPIGGLDWFIMPVAIALLIGAAVLGEAHPQPYVSTAWSLLHRGSAFGGAAAFAVAGAAGAMYLIVSDRLRNKDAPADNLANRPRLGSLERLENLIDHSVSIGFALLTLGLITGLVKVLHDGGNTRLGPRWFTSPKVVLAACVWAVYALALHTPFTPSLRGRRAAMLSIIGFALMVGVLVAVQFMPTAAGGER